MADLLTIWSIAVRLQLQNAEYVELIRAANDCSKAFSLLSKEVIAENAKLREQLEGIGHAN